MDELLGVIFELFFEIFFNVIAEVFGEYLSRFVYKVEADSNLKNRIKLTISFIFFGLSILLLILALVFKKTLLVTLTLSYLLVLLVSNLFKFINKNIWKKNFVEIIIGWVRRIVHYGFSITLIITGPMFLTSETATIWLVVLSVIAIIVYLVIDIYKLNRFISKRREYKYYE